MVGIGTLGLAVALLTTLFARGNGGLSDRIVAAVNEAIDSDSTRFECDRVHGDLFGAAVVERPRLLVKSRSGGEVTWAKARRLRAEYSLLELLLTRRRSIRLSIDGPEVALTHDSNGNLIVPKFGARRGRPARTRVTRIDISLRDGTVSLDRGGFRFASILGRAVARMSPSATTLDVRQLEGKSAMPGRPGLFRASGVASIEGTRLRVDPLRVALPKSRIASRIDWDLARARVVSSSAEVDPLDLEEIMRLFDTGVALTGSLRGSVAFAGDPVSGSGHCRLEGTLGGETLDTLVARATLLPGAIRIDAARARIRQAEVMGRGLFETRGSMNAEAVLRNVNPALLPWWKLPDQTPEGSLSGRVLLTARRSRPKPSAEVAIEFAPSRVGRVRIAGGRARLRYGPTGILDVDSLAVEVPGGRIGARGRLAADSTITLSLAATIRDLGAMDSLLAPLVGESGSGRVTASLSGPIARPEFRGEGHLGGGRLDNGLAFDSLHVDARGRLGPNATAMGDVRLTGLRAGSRRLGTLEATLTADRLITLNRFRLASGDTTLAVHGVIRPVARGAEVALDSVALGIGAARWLNVEPVAASIVGDHVTVGSAALGIDGGTLRVSGEAWLREGKIDARGVLAKVDLARAFGLPDSVHRVAGLVDGEFAARGTMADPELTANLGVRAFRARGFEGDSLDAVFHYVPGQLDLERVSWSEGPSRVLIRGTVRSGLTLDQWIHMASGADRSWGGKMDLALEVDADSLDLGVPAALVPALKGAAGYASGHARVTGSAAAPVIAMRARGSGLAYQGVGVESAELEAQYAARRVSIQRLDLRQGGAASRIEGSIPVDLSLGASRRWLSDEPLELHARMPDADFSVASLFVPLIASSAGRMNLQADVSGTPHRPKVSGTVKLTDGVIRFAGRAEVIQQVAVEGTLDEERLTITKFTATEGKRGKLSGSGSWRWPGAAGGGAYEIQVRATDFTTTDQETYAVRFTGSFTIRDAAHPNGTRVPRVTGSAFVSRGDLTLDLAKPAAGPPEALPFLYEISVEVPRNLWYRNLDTEVELGGPRLVLRSVGTGDQILGELEVLRGKYYYLYSEWRIDRGRISFNRLDRIDPEVNVEAETRVQSPGGERSLETVKLSLTGYASALKIRPFDDRGSSPSYLWKVLSIGQFSSFGGEGLASGSATSGPDVTLPIKNYLFRNAERWLADARIIDTIDLRTGQATAGPTPSGAKGIGEVGVGKYVTPELYVRYSRDFSSSIEQRIGAEYRVTRYLLLKGEQVQRSAGKQGRDQQYNLDLKVRLEY